MAGTLTRSRIEAFDQTANQLSQCATQWRAAASELDQAAQGYVSQIANPSGTQWQGQASLDVPIKSAVDGRRAPNLSSCAQLPTQLPSAARVRPDL